MVSIDTLKISFSLSYINTYILPLFYLICKFCAGSQNQDPSVGRESPI